MFGGWDIFDDNCYEAAKTAGVLEDKLLDQVKDELSAIKPMPAVFDRQYVKRLDGPNVKKGKNKKDLAEQLIADIRKFKADNKLRSARHGLVRQHGGLHDRAAVPQVAGGVRKGPRGERSGDFVQHDLRLRRDQRRHSVRERGAEPERGRFPRCWNSRRRPDRRSAART